MSRQRTPLGAAMLAMILELYRQSPPPPAGVEAHWLWLRFLIRLLIEVLREIDRALARGLREAAEIGGSDCSRPGGPPSRSLPWRRGGPAKSSARAWDGAENG